MTGCCFRNSENARKAACGRASLSVLAARMGVPPPGWVGRTAPQGCEAPGSGGGGHGAWSAARACAGSGFSPPVAAPGVCAWS